MVAFQRLHKEHGITQQEFCAALPVPQRTFQSWMHRPPAPPKPPPSPPARPRSPRKDRRRGRFDLEHTLPGLQVMADTTQLELFAVPMRLVAVQDPGNRDSDLWEAFDLDEVEDAKKVSAVIEAATADRPGLQLITDQGRPYLAKEAREAYEAAGLEHRPAKEHTPTAKATLERSFGIIKPVLMPIVNFTRELTHRIQALRDGRLAQIVGRYVIALALDAYRLGIARAEALAETPTPRDRELLAAIAAEQREAVSEARASRRQFLERLHDEFQMEGSRELFVRSLKDRYALEDLEAAERAFRAAPRCRCAVKKCDRYYVAILRRIVEEAEGRRRQARRRHLDHCRRRNEAHAEAVRQEALERSPEARVSRGLDLLAAQWIPQKSGLWANGSGIGLTHVRGGLNSLISRDGPSAAADTAEVIWRAWKERNRGLAAPIIDAVHRVYRTARDELLTANTDFTQSPAQRILYSPPSPRTPRSPP